MNRAGNRIVILTAILLIVGMAEVGTVGHAQDNVFLNSPDGGKSKLRGQVKSTSAFEVTVEIDGKSKVVPVSEIKKITFSGEPRGLGRARDHVGSERYDDCLASIEKIDNDSNSKFVKQELEFLNAYSAGKKAMRGNDAATKNAAEQRLSEFIRSNSDSYRLVPAVDLYAQVLMANGKTALAQREFNKLTKSKWREYEIRGFFFEGETLVHQGDLVEAAKSYNAMAALSDGDNKSRQFKLLADCQLAKISALQGNADAAISTVENIIENENSDNSRLFAHAYNALGTCHLNANNIKKACRAFLHTELLFSTEPDAHAEALYNLAKIWPKLNETDRANRARETLTSRYRNSIWAAKL